MISPSPPIDGRSFHRVREEVAYGLHTGEGWLELSQTVMTARLSKMVLILQIHFNASSFPSY